VACWSATFAMTRRVHGLQDEQKARTHLFAGW
jgi:hypothetical protein